MSDLESFLDRHANASWITIDADVSVRTAPDSVRSYLSDGRGVAWSAPGRTGLALAIDGELESGRPSPRLREVAGDVSLAEFWRRWTLCEVAAKLVGVPLGGWLRWPGLQVPQTISDQLHWRYVRVDGVLVCCGAMRVIDAAPKPGQLPPDAK